jgi:hypothetical protein
MLAAAARGVYAAADEGFVRAAFRNMEHNDDFCLVSGVSAFCERKLALFLLLTLSHAHAGSLANAHSNCRPSQEPI